MARLFLPATGNADACVARCGGRPGETAREAEHAACSDRFGVWNSGRPNPELIKLERDSSIEPRKCNMDLRARSAL